MNPSPHQSELDKRIKEILLQAQLNAFKPLDVLSPEEAIAQIHKAFSDAGYIQAHSLPIGVYNATGKSLVQIASEEVMTGQEWLTRFSEECIKLGNKPLTPELVSKAAQRAAGLTDE